MPESIIIGNLNSLLSYPSVPNRRVGRNKRAGGKILKKTLIACKCALK